MAPQTEPIEAGDDHLPARAPWVEEFKKEILSFPASKHDDQIDALSQALQRAFAPGPPVAVFGSYGRGSESSSKLSRVILSRGATFAVQGTTRVSHAGT